MRAGKVTDFPVEVEGVGKFIFGRRTLRDGMAIAVEYSRQTEAEEKLSNWAMVLGEAVATIMVLMVEAPEGWVLEEIDPLAPDGYDQIMRVFTALRSAENRFRSEGKPEKGRARNVRDGGVLVPETVQPAAE